MCILELVILIRKFYILETFLVQKFLFVCRERGKKTHLRDWYEHFCVFLA